MCHRVQIVVTHRFKFREVTTLETENGNVTLMWNYLELGCKVANSLGKNGGRRGIRTPEIAPKRSPQKPVNVDRVAHRGGCG